jgi:type II secretory pathway component GspD/PulD (secretin)
LTRKWPGYSRPGAGPAIPNAQAVVQANFQQGAPPGVATNVPPGVAPGVPPGLPPGVAPAGGTADPKRALALDKLDRARLELKAGNYTTARKLAEDAYDPSCGTQKDAEMVLRDIDAEEHAQRLLAAQRSFQAGLDAYLRGDHQRALSIFASVDVHLLPPQQQQRLREVMATRELQPQGVVQAEHKVLLQPVSSGQAPGVAVATDQSQDPIDQVRAMEKVLYDQMLQRNLQAQRSALELFKAGQEMKAIEVINGQLAQVDQAQFAPEMARQLKSPLEKRLEEFRRLQAVKLLDTQRQKTDKSLFAGEAQREAKVKKQQQEVADLIKQCGALNREGKYKDCLALAYKAKELDPDNVAAGAIITTTNILINQQKYDSDKKQNEDLFIEALRTGDGPMPSDAEPFKLDAAAIARHKMRKDVPTAISNPRKDPKERAIEYRLDQPIHFGFRDTPLGEAIESLSKLSAIPIYDDKLALQEASINLNHPLTMDCNGLSMKSALNILLGQIRLTYVIRDQSLIITTLDKAKANFKQVVYPVADLIVPVDNNPLPEVNDLTAILQKHLNSQYHMFNNTSSSPVTAPYGLPTAPPVSSLSTGLGGAFAANSQSQPTSPGYSATPKRARGETMQDLLIDLIKGTIHPHTWREMGGPGTIQYYPLGMALVINQTQEVQGDVADLLAALRRLQDMEVAIEMRLVSVSESFYERIGVDFDVNLRTPINPGNEQQLLSSNFTPFQTVNRNLNFNRMITGLTPAGTLTPDLNIPIKSTSFNFSVPPFGGYTSPGLDGGLSLGLAFLSDIQVFMILEAAQGDSRSNIMQAPKITVFNGQTAFITVSTSQFVNLGITAVPFNGQIVFVPNNVPIPIGVALTVTPVVSADRRFVRLNLTPTMTNRIGNDIPVSQVQIPIPNMVEGPLGQGVTVGQPVLFNTFMQTPTVATIAMSTTVNVPDGGTVLLGGLKTMAEGRNEAGPPILSKIPYLSRLFRNVGWGREGQSLMILVTPRIIINEEEERIFLGIDQPIPRQ